MAILTSTVMPILFMTTLIAYWWARAIYNSFLHPLSDIPGPRSWGSSRLPSVRALVSGNFTNKVRHLHGIYGPVVRIAPNEVTFAHPDAFQHILQGRSHHKEFLKDPTWWARAPGLPDTILSAINPQKHARMRKVLSPGFSPRALKAQEPLLQKYTGLLILRLREMIVKDKNITEQFDIVPWLNFTTFDIFGDIGFAESFDCLQHSRYHPWISLLFNSVKLSSYVIALRFYPGLSHFVNLITPKSLQKMKAKHFSQIVAKVNRRLNLESHRLDLMQQVVDDMEKSKCSSLNESSSMSIDEIYATFMVLVTAGSETTATVLAGLMTYLLATSHARKKLVAELMANFVDESDITLKALTSLPYLNAVISEGLRLCPPVPYMLPRQVPPGGDVVCGYWLPSGTCVSIQSFTLFRDPDLFADSHSFIPERWLPEAFLPTSPFANDRRDAVQAFSLGSRSCLGKDLAWSEIRLILSRLWWNFEVRPASENVKWENLRTFLLIEKQPILVRLSDRVTE